MGFPGGSEGKVSACGRPGFDPWVGKAPWRNKWQPTPVLVWEIPQKEEPGRLQTMGLQTVAYD